SGRGFPSSRWSSGLGSNVSMWLGPPCMKRKITLLAGADKGGRFGARGFGLLETVAPEQSCRLSKSPNASAPKPKADLARNSRRLNAITWRPQDDMFI